MAHASQIAESEFKADQHEELACIFGSDRELSVSHGIEWFEYWEDGLGLTKAACFEAVSGCFFSLLYHAQSSRTRSVTVVLLQQEAGIHLEAALETLGMSSRDLNWISNKVRLTNHGLYREDDNGARFHVGDFVCRADAMARMRELAAGGHKQHYFTEPLKVQRFRLEFDPDGFKAPEVVSILSEKLTD